MVINTTSVHQLTLEIQKHKHRVIWHNSMLQTKLVSPHK